MVATRAWLKMIQPSTIICAPRKPKTKPEIAVAVMLVGLSKSLRLALSLTGIYVATGLAFSGFSFPRAAMSPVAQWWGGLLPFTHYLPVQQGQWLGGASPGAWAQGMVPLLLFIAVPLLVGLPLLYRAVRQPQSWGGR